jgi:alanine-alpha-ketoisovalerate/valine-pyruvate aminotransferase
LPVENKDEIRKFCKILKGALVNWIWVQKIPVSMSQIRKNWKKKTWQFEIKIRLYRNKNFN